MHICIGTIIIKFHHITRSDGGGNYIRQQLIPLGLVQHTSYDLWNKHFINFLYHSPSLQVGNFVLQGKCLPQTT